MPGDRISHPSQVIRVANTWHNRLLADESLPADKRVSHVSQAVRLTSNPDILKSGLLGPATVKTVK